MLSHIVGDFSGMPKLMKRLSLVRFFSWAALSLLPWVAARIDKVRAHMIGLLCGAAYYASFFVIRDAQTLLISKIGIGIAWASILAMPYAILASSLPSGSLASIRSCSTSLSWCRNCSWRR